MAHGITTTDKAFRRAGSAVSWHKLETPVEDLSIESPEMEFFRGWNVEVVPIKSAIEGANLGNEIVSIPHGRHFGIVKDRYKPIQNEEFFTLIEAIAGENDAKLDFVASIYGGDKIFANIALKDGEYEVVRGDNVKDYVIFSWSHTGKGAGHVFGSGIRAVCANTERWALEAAQEDKEGTRYRRIIHKGDIAAKLESTRKAWSDVTASIQAKREQERQLAESRLTTQAIEHYFGSVVDYIMKAEKLGELDKAVLETDTAKIENRPMTLDEMADYTDSLKKLGKKKANEELRLRRKMEVMAYVRSVFERESNQLPEATDSAWLAYNAVSHYADHGLNYRGDDQISRRFESNLTGRSDDIKQYAYATAIDAASLSVAS